MPGYANFYRNPFTDSMVYCHCLVILRHKGFYKEHVNFSGKKGKKNKGKTVPLNDFLSNTISWSDQVDEADKLGEFTRKPVLPVAPRSARALEIDESKIPKNPPYVAYVSNLSYELQDGDILNAFVDLNVSKICLLHG